jgi:DNA helicase II / ATP-dependent DNA helicase PcrA
MIMTVFTPSKYQHAIFMWAAAHAVKINTRCAALIICAVAGSGKTTTIVKMAEYIPVEHLAVFLAFNKAIAMELATRLPKHVQAKTLNALGFGAVRKAFPGVQVDDKKTRRLLDEHMATHLEILLTPDEQKAICSLVAKAKAHALVPVGEGYVGVLATEEEWARLQDHYSLDFGGETEEEALERSSRAYRIAGALLSAGLERTTVVDFDDMMYFVVAHDLKDACTQYDWIIIDEAQDVSHVQRMMLHMFLKHGGRLVAVGDDRQAIYGFRGSDADSMAAIQREFNAERLPLSISYRCAQAVVRKAREIVSYIEPAETAPEGRVEELRGLDPEELTNKDMIVCRMTAPVITIAYRLLAQRIPCHVQGRDIGAGLIAQIKRIAGKNSSVMEIAAFKPRLDAWRNKEMLRAQKADDEREMERIEDRYQCLLAVMNYEHIKTVAEMMDEINSLFERSTGVKLSTVHRAKGLEAERVYVLDPQLMPSKYARKEWQQGQEANLQYVAYTRARQELYFIRSQDIG